nr:S49 family peptidase [Pseudenhygromyxa sp. WMMC2535]
MRGSVSLAVAWDYGVVGVGVHAGLGEAVDGVAIKARFTSQRQGRAYWGRLVDVEAIELGGIGSQRGLIATLRALERAEAAGDRAVILIKADGFGLGWGAGQELRDALRRVRDAGGHVFAWAETPNLRDYWIASVAEQVYTHPAGHFSTVGIGSRRLYFKDALAKLGVEVEAAHIEEYKSAHENFTRNDRSPADTEQRVALLDDTWEVVVHDIAQARGLSKAKVRELITASPLSPEAALAGGLADAVMHRDEIGENIGEDIGAKVSLREFGPTTPERETWGVAPYLAVVLIEGTIIDGKSRYIPLLGLQYTGGDTIAETLRQLRADSACKGIVLRVDSGGGSAFASEVMWREVQRTHAAWEKDKRGSPAIVVSMSDVAASGGYYVPVAADEIFAEPLTITGSIGVVSMHFDVSGLMDILGVGIDRVDRGSEAIDMNSIWQPWSEVQREKVREGIEQIYALFLERVAKGRGKTADEVDAVARGRVWSGKRAKDIGLIDEYGGLREALAEVRARSGQPGFRELELRVLPRRLTLVQLILRGAGSLVVEPVERAVSAKEREAREGEVLPQLLDAAAARLPLSLLFLPQDEALTMIPGEIEIE